MQNNNATGERPETILEMKQGRKVMKKVFEVNEKCASCNGTGLYIGMAERDGAAVVCSMCNGTGCHKFRHEYEVFVAREPHPTAKYVYRCNPGICVGNSKGVTFEDFGGMSYTEWDCGMPFPDKSEDREHTCPAWWFQTADYAHKPEWTECRGSLGYRFPQCLYFGNKAACWARFDREQTDKDTN